MKNKTLRNTLLLSPLLLAIMAVYLSPFYITTAIAFKNPTDLSSYWKFPSNPTWENFATAIQNAGILESLGRTVIITAFVLLISVVVSALGAYPLARRQTKVNKAIQAFVLGVMMVPPLSILVPLYSIIVSMGGVNEYWAIILVMTTYQLPQAMFLYINFINAIPVALDEAATIDGCGPIRTFFHIIMPQLKPVTASVIILACVNCWNDFQFSRYILQSTDMNTVTLSISSFFSQTYSNLYAASASALLAVLPVVIVFLFLQKYFVQGMIDSAVK